MDERTEDLPAPSAIALGGRRGPKAEAQGAAEFQFEVDEGGVSDVIGPSL